MTNDDLRHFDPKKKRIPVCLEKLELKVMNELFAVGNDYLSRLEEARASEKRKREKKAAGAMGEQAQNNGPGLRKTDP